MLAGGLASPLGARAGPFDFAAACGGDGGAGGTSGMGGAFPVSLTPIPTGGFAALCCGMGGTGAAGGIGGTGVGIFCPGVDCRGADGAGRETGCTVRSCRAFGLCRVEPPAAGGMCGIALFGGGIRGIVSPDLGGDVACVPLGRGGGSAATGPCADGAFATFFGFCFCFGFGFARKRPRGRSLCSAVRTIFRSCVTSRSDIGSP